MDRSSPSQLSLPWALEASFDESGTSVLLVNLSRFGDTMVRIGQHVNAEFLEWIRARWTYRGVLVSAGGNDFIDAAAAVPAGQGILNIFVPGMDAAACIATERVAVLRRYMDRHFDTLLATVRRHQPDAPIYLNSYCVPVARDAPAYPGGKAWLHRAYTNHGIPDRLWSDVTKEVFARVDETVLAWSRRDAGIVKVPTGSVDLIPADPWDGGASGDWQNEIHPSASGWVKLATAWRKAMAL